MERDEVTEKVIGAFYEVYNVLGSGVLEKVYESQEPMFLGCVPPLN